MKAALAIFIVGLTAATILMLSSSRTSELESQFQAFLTEHKVGYSNNNEYDFRMEVFKKNLETIDELNAANPHATFGVNKFADRTPEEMQKLFALAGNQSECSGPKNITSNPRSVSWQANFTAVRDQGECGSCWAFSAVGAAEGRYALANNSTNSTIFNTTFSEQQLVDCDGTSYGCSGGWMENAFTHWIHNDICNRTEYNYTGREGNCTKCHSGIRLSSCNTLPQNTTKIVTELANGPIAIAVDAYSWIWYQGGVISNCTTDLNHGVTLVGYNSTERTINIRNSWGANWGERGYIRLNATNGTCGWDQSASIPNFNSTVNATLAFE